MPVSSTNKPQPRMSDEQAFVRLPACAANGHRLLSNIPFLDFHLCANSILTIPMISKD